MINFFVYGTLKQGYGNHRLLANATYLGDGTVHGMQLYHGPGFPYAFTGDGKVKGEVYAVRPCDIGRLDALEGYPHHYDRKEVQVLDAKGEITHAWMYYVHNRPRGEFIPDGVWSRR